MLLIAAAVTRSPCPGSSPVVTIPGQPTTSEKTQFCYLRSPAPSRPGPSQSLAQPHTLLVHCCSSLGRTKTFIAVYKLIEEHLVREIFVEPMASTEQPRPMQNTLHESSLSWIVDTILKTPLH